MRMRTLGMPVPEVLNVLTTLMTALCKLCRLYHPQTVSVSHEDSIMPRTSDLHCDIFGAFTTTMV